MVLVWYCCNPCEAGKGYSEPCYGYHDMLETNAMASCVVRKMVGCGGLIAVVGNGGLTTGESRHS